MRPRSAAADRCLPPCATPGWENSNGLFRPDVMTQTAAARRRRAHLRFAGLDGFCPTSSSFRCRRISIQMSLPPCAATTVNRSPARSRFDGRSCRHPRPEAVEGPACVVRQQFGEHSGHRLVGQCPRAAISDWPDGATMHGCSPTCRTSASPSASRMAVSNEVTSGTGVPRDRSDFRSN